MKLSVVNDREPRGARGAEIGHLSRKMANYRPVAISWNKVDCDTLYTPTHTHTRPLNGPQGAIIDHKTFVGLKFNSFMFDDFNKSRGSSCLWL